MDLGIIMKVNEFDPDDLEFLLARKFEAFFPEIVDKGDPGLAYSYLHSSQIRNGFNFSAYKNPRVDSLLDKARITLDPEKRKAIYYEFQEELLQDPPGIFLFWMDQLIGIHKRFRGVKFSPAGVFNNIHEWYVPKEEQKYN